MSVPTFVAKNASWFHGNKYPENPKPSTRRKIATPLIHVSSRGARYDFMKKTVTMCRKAKKTIRFADQECTDRISHPNGTVVMMNSTDSNASSADGR